MECLVPRLIIQPLVENAIRHGVLKLDEQGLILVRIYAYNQYLRIDVVDNGLGFPCDYDLQEELPAETLGGIGLRNVNKRLQLFYGSDNKLTWEQSPQLGTTVRLDIPILAEDEDRLG